MEVGMARRPGVQITLTPASQLPELSGMLNTTCKLTIPAVPGPQRMNPFHFHCLENVGMGQRKLALRGGEGS